MGIFGHGECLSMSGRTTVNGPVTTGTGPLRGGYGKGLGRSAVEPDTQLNVNAPGK